MTSRSNPYEPASETAQQSPVSGSPFRWPQRLTCGILLLGVFVFVSLPAIQATRSTSIYDRTIGSLESLVFLIPGIVVVPAIAISAIRMIDISIVAYRIAILLLVAAILYDGWLCVELLRGPARGF